jgi:hypothetical protein
MADERKRQDRPVLRVFQCHRLEEQLWSLTYLHILPVIRKRAGGAKNQQRLCEKTPISTQKARRA